MEAGEGADRPAEAVRRQAELEIDPGLPDHPVPARDADIAVIGIALAGDQVHGVARRDFDFPYAGAVLGRLLDAVERVGFQMILEPVLVRPALEAVGEIGRGVGRAVGAEQVEGGGVPVVDVFLDQAEIDRAVVADALRVVGVQLLHDLQRPPDDPAEAGLADEHVVGFLGQHEAAGARQRIEGALGQHLELELAVPVGEVGEAEERHPVVDRLVEGRQDARVVDVAGMALQQVFGLLAAVAAEMGVEQVDHGPEVPALLDVDLEQVAHVVERRAGVGEHALLFDRSRLGIALGDDQAAQVGAELARHLLPHRLAEIVAEADGAVFRPVGQEDAPAVVRHLDVAVGRPALGVDRGRRAQVDVPGLEVAVRAHLAPPVQEGGLPALQRALELAVGAQVDVVGNLLGIVDRHERGPRGWVSGMAVAATGGAPGSVIGGATRAAT